MFFFFSFHLKVNKWSNSELHISSTSCILQGFVSTICIPENVRIEALWRSKCVWKFMGKSYWSVFRNVIFYFTCKEYCEMRFLLTQGLVLREFKVWTWFSCTSTASLLLLGWLPGKTNKKKTLWQQNRPLWDWNIYVVAMLILDDTEN